MKSRQPKRDVYQQSVSDDKPGEITELLFRWNEGDDAAREKVTQLIYDELRSQARRHMRRERANHTLQPTDLVNEIFLRLLKHKKLNWKSRAQFFGLTARLMRNTLVDHVRQRKARRGDQRQTISYSLAGDSSEQKVIDILAVHEALQGLETIAQRQAQIAELKFFGGLTIEEISQVLNISHATVERDWQTASAWLLSKLS
jgi:RNA polymerase sigma factor (TIGR02999 family)